MNVKFMFTKIPRIYGLRVPSLFPAFLKLLTSFTLSKERLRKPCIQEKKEENIASRKHFNTLPEVS